MQKLRLKTNNLTGFMEGSEFDGVVIDQPNARGRIQYQMTPTLNTSTGCGSGVIVRERESTELHEKSENMDKQEKQLGPLKDWNELKELIDSNKLTVRKLTPRECWRLMDMTDEDFDRAAAVSSDAQLYKQAGNSIVVVCLEAIFENILINGNTGQKSLMDY